MPFLELSLNACRLERERIVVLKSRLNKKKKEEAGQGTYHVVSFLVIEKVSQGCGFGALRVAVGTGKK